MKKLLSIILSLIMAFSLTACSNTADSGNAVTQDNEVAADKTADTEEEAKEDTVPEVKPDSLEAVEEMVDKDVEATIASLVKDYEELETEIDTYDMYKSNTEKMEAFYDHVIASHQELTVRLRKYALAYAEIILASDSDDKYDEMEEMYDVIYDRAGEEIYDEIYDGILENMYDAFYDGILEEAYDTVEYSEWSDFRSEEYDWWSDARSEVYEEWSDFRSEVYDFWSDMRSELWDDNMEKAREEIEDFRADIEKMEGKGEKENSEAETEVTVEENMEQEDSVLTEEKAIEEKTEQEDGVLKEKAVEEKAEQEDSTLAEETIVKEENADLVDGMRLEFKEAMDSYEAFYDEYCEFMAEYKANPTDMKLLAEYADMMVKLADMDKKFQSWKDSDLNHAELKYYAEVNGRITQKLLEVAY